MKELVKLSKIPNVSRDRIYLFQNDRNFHWYLFNERKKLWRFHCNYKSISYYMSYQYAMHDSDVLYDVNCYLMNSKRPYFIREKVYELDNKDELDSLLVMEELIN